MKRWMGLIVITAALMSVGCAGAGGYRYDRDYRDDYHYHERDRNRHEDSGRGHREDRDNWARP